MTCDFILQNVTLTLILIRIWWTYTLDAAPRPAGVSEKRGSTIACHLRQMTRASHVAVRGLIKNARSVVVINFDICDDNNDWKVLAYGEAVVRTVQIRSVDISKTVTRRIRTEFDDGGMVWVRVRTRSAGGSERRHESKGQGGEVGYHANDHAL
jgi:hypothetical protein